MTILNKNTIVGIYYSNLTFQWYMYQVNCDNNFRYKIYWQNQYGYILNFIGVNNNVKRLL